MPAAQTVLVAGPLCVAERKVIYSKVWPLAPPCNSRQLHFQIDLFGENQQWLCFQSTGKWSPVNALCKSTGPQQVEWGVQANSSAKRSLILQLLLSSLACQALCKPVYFHNRPWGPQGRSKRQDNWDYQWDPKKKLELKNDKCPTVAFISKTNTVSALPFICHATYPNLAASSSTHMTHSLWDMDCHTSFFLFQ